MTGFRIGGWVALCAVMLAVPAWLAGELWALAALRHRPWQLESLLEIQGRRIRAADHGGIRSQEVEAIEARLREARLCLATAEVSWVLSRDYTPCLRSLLAAKLDGFSLELRQHLRDGESRARLGILLATLEREGRALLRAGNGSPPAAVRAAARRKESYLEEARQLRTMGHDQAALQAALRAQLSLRAGTDIRDEALARFMDQELLALWNRQVGDVLAWSRKSGLAAVIVDKLEHRCYLIERGRAQKSYTVNLGRNWYEDKLRENDAATPEGVYRVTRKFISPRFGYALPVDYPNAEDRRRFASLKKDGRLPGNARIGGLIEIHGRGRPDEDWTDGCVALEDGDMKDLYLKAYSGMPVVIIGTTSAGATWKK